MNDILVALYRELEISQEVQEVIRKIDIVLKGIAGGAILRAFFPVIHEDAARAIELLLVA